MRIAPFLLSLTLLSFAACKQPEGGRCQINEDCESPLICSAAEPHICLPSGSEVIIDAAPAPDSRFDARIADANTSPPDAGATPDASNPDAPVSAPDAQ